jgi:hypothetical protein
VAQYGFKVHPETDKDIYEFMEGMDKGQRSLVLREIVRWYLSGKPEYPDPSSAYEDLHQKLDALLAKVERGAVVIAPTTSYEEPDPDVLSHEEIAQRQRLIKSTDW